MPTGREIELERQRMLERAVELLEKVSKQLDRLEEQNEGKSSKSVKKSPRVSSQKS